MGAADLSPGNLRRSARRSASSTSHNTFLTILVETPAELDRASPVRPTLARARSAGGRSGRDALRSPDVRWLLLGAVAALGVYAFAANSIDFRFFFLFVPAVPWLLLGFFLRRSLSQRAPGWS